MLAYYNGNLVPIRLDAMPERTWDPLIRSVDRVGVFYDGFWCVCNFEPGDTVGVCACFTLTPVLRSLDQGPLVRAISIYFVPGDPPIGELTSYSQIEEAVRENRIHTWEWPGVYRLIVRGVDRKATDEAALGTADGGRLPGPEKTFAAPAPTTTWGAVKGIFR
jgi:hypothetical protein